MHRCDFCGEFHVKHLVKGERASICSDCIGVADSAVFRHKLVEFLTVPNLVGALFLSVLALGGLL